MVNVIQVGLGAWGFDWATNVLPTVDTIRVVAYVDGHPAARERFQTELGVPPTICFETLEEAIKAVDADVVLGTLRTDAHFPVARQALRAGKHVIVEKPFTTSVSEAKELVAIADAENRVLMVSQNYRHFPAPIMAAELIRNQELGHVGLVGIEFRQHAPSIGYRYWDFPDPLLADMSIHHFDLMRMVLDDEPKQVSCRTWNLPGSPFQNHPVGIATIEFAGGTIVSYRGSWMSGSNPTAWAGEWTIDCQNGEMWWTSRGTTAERASRDRLVLHRRGTEPAEQTLPELEHVDRAGTIAAMAEAVTTGTMPRNFSSGHDNLQSLALMQAAILSAGRDGDWVSLEEVLA